MRITVDIDQFFTINDIGYNFLTRINTKHLWPKNYVYLIKEIFNMTQIAKINFYYLVVGPCVYGYSDIAINHIKCSWHNLVNLKILINIHESIFIKMHNKYCVLKNIQPFSPK